MNKKWTRDESLKCGAQVSVDGCMLKSFRAGRFRRQDLDRTSPLSFYHGSPIPYPFLLAKGKLYRAISRVSRIEESILDPSRRGSHSAFLVSFLLRRRLGYGFLNKPHSKPAAAVCLTLLHLSFHLIFASYHCSRKLLHFGLHLSAQIFPLVFATLSQRGQSEIPHFGGRTFENFQSAMMP